MPGAQVQMLPVPELIKPFDQGAVSRTGMYMHELMHDGRHLLGLPCH